LSHRLRCNKIEENEDEEMFDIGSTPYGQPPTTTTIWEVHAPHLIYYIGNDRDRQRVSHFQRLSIP